MTTSTTQKQAAQIEDIAVRIALLMRDHDLALELALEKILAKQSEHTAFTVKMLQAFNDGRLVMANETTAH